MSSLDVVITGVSNLAAGERPSRTLSAQLLIKQLKIEYEFSGNITVISKNFDPVDERV